VEVNLRVELDRNGIVNVARNITDRTRVTAALRERQDHYRDLVEHSSNLICTHDLDGRMLSVNEAATRILGYSTGRSSPRPSVPILSTGLSLLARSVLS